jgi:predicted exporter
MGLRARALVWLGVVMVVVLAVWGRWPSATLFQTDVRALLPTVDQAEYITRAERRRSAPLEQATVWLVGTQTAQGAAAAAGRLAERLRAHDAFAEVTATVDRQRRDRLAEALAPYRHGLLTRADAERLRVAPEQWVKRQLARQYSVAGAAGRVRDDPLNLFRRFLQAGLEGRGGASARSVDGVPIVEGSQRAYGLVRAQVRQAAFQASAEPPVLEAWRAQLAWAEARSLRLHATGAPLYSAYAAASAHREMSLIGGVSLLAVTLLLIGRFRSPRPLAATLGVIAAGVGGGFAGTLLAFAQMHLITLVFGASVIGVAVDYALHYLCDSLRPGWTPEAGLRHVLPALRLALMTSVLAFGSLALAPFPALRQVAVFTASGLIAAWLTVVLLLPLLVRPARAPAPRQRASPGRARGRWLFAGVLLAALPGLMLLEPSDDIRLLYAAPDRLSHDDAAIQDLLARTDGDRFLLVSADSRQALLRRQEALLPALDRLAERGEIAAYRAVVELVPSKARQRDNERLVRALVADGHLQGYLRQLGFDRALIAQRVRTIRAEGPYLGAERGLELLGERLERLWLGCRDGRCRGAVTVSGAGAGAALAALAGERAGVRWVDQVADVNAAMREHRRLSLGLLGLALGGVAAVLWPLLGLRRALRVVAVPVMAVLVSLAVVGYTGALFSVFNLMALLLVVGVGIDYALFYQCATPEARPAAALGIGMAALTTVLAFGLLAFSQTPVISAFGVTLLPGLAGAYLFALLTARQES